MKRKAPKIVTLIVLTTVSIVFWVFVSLYSIVVKNSDINVPPEILTPLDPTLNINALNSIQGRLYYDEE